MLDIFLSIVQQLCKVLLLIAVLPLAILTVVLFLGIAGALVLLTIQRLSPVLEWLKSYFNR